MDPLSVIVGMIACKVIGAVGNGDSTSTVREDDESPGTNSTNYTIYEPGLSDDERQGYLDSIG